MLRFIVVLAVVATTANAGLLQAGLPVGGVVTTLTSQDSNIYRSYGNLGTVSTQSKQILTPYSSVSKSDVRVSNPGYRVTSPLIAGGYSTLAGPQLQIGNGYLGGVVPQLQRTAIVSSGLGGLSPLGLQRTAIVSPGLGGLSPLGSTIVSSSSGLNGLSPLSSVGVATSGGLLGLQRTGAIVSAAPAIGVAYSSAPAVSRVAYSNGLGVNYGW